MTTVKDVVNPTVYFAVRAFGYALVAFAWLVIAYVFWRGALDGRAEIARLLDARRRRARQIPIPFPVRARVIAFPANRRTRKVTPYA